MTYYEREALDQREWEDMLHTAMERELDLGAMFKFLAAPVPA